MAQLHDYQADPVKPGWYPDASWPSAVRWWDGNEWTKHTRPNDDRVPLRGAPRTTLQTVILVVVLVFAALGLAGLAFVMWMMFAMTQWSSNK